MVYMQVHILKHLISSITMSLHIAYAGLGNMGAQTSTHLAKYAADNGGKLSVWNRSKDKYPQLKETIAPAEFVDELSDLAAADVIFMAVLNDAAALDVVTQLSKAAKGAIIVDHSSVNPKTSSEFTLERN